MYRSPTYKAWVGEAHVAWLQQRNQLSVKSIRGKYTLSIEAYPPDKRLRDIDNLIKVTSDFLEMEGIIENDSLAKRIEIEWGDKEISHPCVWVAVRPH